MKEEVITGYSHKRLTSGPQDFREAPLQCYLCKRGPDSESLYYLLNQENNTYIAENRRLDFTWVKAIYIDPRTSDYVTVKFLLCADCFLLFRALEEQLDLRRLLNEGV